MHKGGLEVGVDPEGGTHCASIIIPPKASWKGRILGLLLIGDLQIPPTLRSIRQQ